MDKIQNNDSYGLKRLESKNAKNAIIQKLSQDFNLSPIIAEAFYQQVSVYFSEHSNISLSSDEISCEVVCSTEPAGKHIRLTRKVTCRLKLMDINSDFDALANFGLAGMRRLRIERLTRQAYDQGAFMGALHANDKQEVKPAIEELKATVGTLPQKMSIDNGHFSGEYLTTIEEKELDAYVAVGKGEKGTPTSSEKLPKDTFVYEEKEDCFICPNSKKLELKSRTNDGTKIYKAKKKIAI